MPQQAEGAVLEPTLTAGDLKVLRALPPWSRPWDPDYSQDHPVSVWRVGEKLRVMDLEDLHRTLAGLDHLGYAYRCGFAGARRPVRWMRTERGDEAVA